MFLNQQEDWASIAAYLAQRGHTLDQDFDIQALTGGSANFNYLIGLNGKKAVLRRPPNDRLAPGANDVSREYKVLSRLGDAYPPAPRGLLLCEDTSVIGVPFCISEFREGVCIGRDLPPELMGHNNIGDRLCELMFRSLASLHDVNVDSVGLSDLGSGEGYLERQVGGWLKRCFRVTPKDQHHLLQYLHDWLMRNLPKQRLLTLVHNDFKLDNMLLEPATLDINGVVDWDMCTIGDPFLEVMILLSYMGSSDPDDVYQFQCRMPCEADGWWSRRSALAFYLEQRGLELSGKDIEFYWWLAQFRTYGIFTQIYALFKHSGELPGSLSQQECDNIAENGAQLLRYINDHLGQSPDWV